MACTGICYLRWSAAQNAYVPYIFCEGDCACDPNTSGGSQSDKLLIPGTCKDPTALGATSGTKFGLGVGERFAEVIVPIIKDGTWYASSYAVKDLDDGGEIGWPIPGKGDGLFKRLGNWLTSSVPNVQLYLGIENALTKNKDGDYVYKKKPEALYLSSNSNGTPPDGIDKTNRTDLAAAVKSGKGSAFGLVLPKNNTGEAHYYLLDFSGTNPTYKVAAYFLDGDRTFYVSRGKVQ